MILYEFLSQSISLQLMICFFVIEQHLDLETR